VSIDVERGATSEPDERHSRSLREVDRERARRGYADDQRNTRDGRFLNDLEARSAAHRERAPSGGERVIEEHPAEDLVDGVVTPHVFSHEQQAAIAAENGRCVEPSRLVEYGLSAPERGGDFRNDVHRKSHSVADDATPLDEVVDGSATAHAARSGGQRAASRGEASVEIEGDAGSRVDFDDVAVTVLTRLIIDRICVVIPANLDQEKTLERTSEDNPTRWTVAA